MARLRAPLRDVAAAAEPVFPAAALSLPTAIAWSNMDTTGRPEFAASTLYGAYAARDVAMDPVTLCRLPHGTTVLGGNSFVVRAGDAYVGEQLSPLMEDVEAGLAALEAAALSVEDVTEPTVLLARYGEGTWGHWLAEILPRALVAEYACPGRFRFAVAEHTTTRMAAGRGYADSVIESLAAYGIDESRLLRLRADRSYRFAALHSVGGMWSSAVIHPGVLGLLRALPDTPSVTRWPKRLAILRRDTRHRTLFNGDQVEAILRDAGYEPREPGTLAFGEQVSAFRQARHVFGVLGSGLTGLIYAPDGVRVTTAAPEGWFDCFFYMLMQQRDGMNAELRAHTLWTGNGLPRDAPLVVDPAMLIEALSVMDRPAGDLTPDGWATVAGQRLPRRLGRVLTRVDFGSEGNVRPMLRGGWGWQEPQHIFTDGPVSAMELPLPPDADSAGYVLELDVAAFPAPPSLVSRPLGVSCNGHALGVWPLSGVATIVCRLPRAVVADRTTLTLGFAHPVCAPMSMLGTGPDERRLSVAFLGVRLREDVDG